MSEQATGSASRPLAVVTGASAGDRTGAGADMRETRV
jgi:hypothetical protein